MKRAMSGMNGTEGEQEDEAVRGLRVCQWVTTSATYESATCRARVSLRPYNMSWATVTVTIIQGKMATVSARVTGGFAALERPSRALGRALRSQSTRVL